jgi:hypothetical protein
MKENAKIQFESWRFCLDGKRIMLHKPQRDWTMSDWALSDWQQFNDRVVRVETDDQAFSLLYLQHHVWVRPDGRGTDFTGVIMDGRYGGDVEATPDQRRAHFLENYRASCVGRLVLLPDPLDTRNQIFAAVNERICGYYAKIMNTTHGRRTCNHCLSNLPNCGIFPSPI